jgi:hypothetical protein
MHAIRTKQVSQTSQTWGSSSCSCFLVLVFLPALEPMFLRFTDLAGDSKEATKDIDEKFQLSNPVAALYRTPACDKGSFDRFQEYARPWPCHPQ